MNVGMRFTTDKDSYTSFVLVIRIMNILLIIRNFLIYLYVYFNKLNFYTSKSQDEYVQNTGRVSTKIALALLLGSLVSLTFYSGFSKIDQVIAIAVPNFEKYQSLVQDHPSLVCPCSKLDVPYSSFIKLELNYHQVGLINNYGRLSLLNRRYFVHCFNRMKA